MGETIKIVQNKFFSLKSFLYISTIIINPIKVMQFPKYKQNLRLVNQDDTTYVQSYSTLVAKIEDNKMVQLGWWSKTTQKHINYAAKQLGLELVK